MDELLNSGIDAAVSDFLNDLEASDYLSLASYDIRVKFYITNRINMISRVFVTGIQSNMYNYSVGLNISF